MEREAFDLFTKNLQRPLKAILLGVTPELALMDWPKGTELTAVDHCPHMIDHVFPHSKMVLSDVKVLCGDWISLTREDWSADIVVGDGCYVFTDFPGQFDVLSNEIKRVLSPQGRFIIRVYIQPEQTEDIERIFADLFAGKIKSFHAFKWRLVMALHEDVSQGVCLGSVWEAWDKQQLDPDKLAQDFGWNREAIATINHYRGSEGRYFFPTMKEAKTYLSPKFDILNIHLPTYELGERCPTFVLAPH